MRTLTFCLLFLAGASRITAQVIWSEDFESFSQNNFSAPWITAGNPGAAAWSRGVDYDIGGLCFPTTGDFSNMAGVSDIGGVIGMPCSVNRDEHDVLLATPPVSLSGQTHVFFSYESYFQQHTVNGISESATVEISTDDGLSWTVLQHAPVSSGPHTRTAALDLSPYAGNTIRIGFRYRDSSLQGVGWMIDNLSVYTPAQNDLALIATTPGDSLQAYALQGTAMPLSFRVMNNGSQPVSAFSFSCQVAGGGILTQSFSGLNLASLDTLEFICQTPPVLPGAGRYPLKLWVNAAGDAVSANDSASLIAFGASYLPVKGTAVEAGTGTWHAMAPQQYVLMNSLNGADAPVSRIFLHDADPMLADADYTDYIENIQQSYVPFFFFDRRARLDATSFVPVNGGVYGEFDPQYFQEIFQRYKNNFAFAGITLTPEVNPGAVFMHISVKPAVPLQGDYRLEMVLTEDGVQGSATGYAQANNFSGGALGPMGGYETLADPVPATGMTYDFVARSSYAGGGGQPGLLPAGMQPDVDYTTTLIKAFLPEYNLNKLSATVLLVRATDSVVINSATVSLSPAGIREQPAADAGLFVYPNPARDQATVAFYTTGGDAAQLSVTDVTGRLVYAQELVHAGAGMHQLTLQTEAMLPGIYLVTLRDKSGMRSRKLTILGK